MDYLSIRLMCSFLSGVLISQSGSLIQLSSRNILASPSTLGFDGLVVLWVLFIHSIALYAGMDGDWIMLGIPVFVMIGIFFRNVLKGKEQFERIILIGITFNLAVGAIFSLWQFLFLAFNLPFPVELWFGHFRFAEASQLYKLLIVEFGFFISLKYLWGDLALFTLGRSVSKNYRVNEKSLFAFIFIFISLSTFMVVSAFGAFSFLGLVFPLVARKIWFKNFDLKGEIIFGGLTNGLIFMLIDYLCYEFPFFGAEIPVGLIATGVGAVSLILILWKSTDRELLAKPKK